MIHFTVPGAPVAWTRSRHNGKQHYNDPKYRAWKDAIAWQAKASMGSRKPLEGPLSLVVTFHLPIPISWSRRKQSEALDGTIRPDGRPDLDNLAKAVGDGCNGVVYVDDCQVVHMVAMKVYSLHPCVSVTISQVSKPVELARFREVA